MRRIATILAGVLAFGFLTSGALAWASSAPARTTCTSAGGITDGGNVGPPGSAYAYWTALPEPEPACQEQIRVEAYASSGSPADSGWLKSTTANIDRKTLAAVPGGRALAKARLESQFTDDPASRLCKTFYPTVGNWHPCTDSKTVTTADVKVAATYYHICLNVNHSLCATANGAGHALTVVSSGADKWQAIPDGSGGLIMWQNGSGHCMTSAQDGGTSITNGGCNGGTYEDWTVGGSGDVTFENQGDAGEFLGINGPPQAGRFLYVKPAMTGFYYGWVTIPA